MNYCTVCHIQTEDKKCPKCGSKRNIREVQDDDFCLFVSLTANYSQILESLFTAEKIAYVAMPIRMGFVTYATVSTKPNGKEFYVHYCDIEKAKNIYENFLSNK